MPRRKATVTESAIVDEPMPGMENLGRDPEPVAERRRPGRPRGSATKKPGALRGANGRIVSKASLKAQAATELLAVGTMLARIWEWRDPECAGVLFEPVDLPTGQTQRLAGIVEEVVDILGQNDKVLAVFTNTGMIARLGVLGMLTMPIVSRVWAAHGPGGHGHRPIEQAETSDYATLYPVG